METKARIREFIKGSLGIDESSIKDGDPLYTSGIIDSFAFIEMMSFLESELDIKLDLSELSIEDMDTIEALSKIRS
jgi:acyl carrier protein